MKNTLRFFCLLAIATATVWSQTPKAPTSSDQASASQRPLWFRLFEKRFDRNLLLDRTRAVTIPIDENELLPIRTGDTVDVLAVFDARTQKGSETLCATILQNIRVLGVKLSGNAKEKGALRLRLNPSEAQYAVLASRQAELSVVLRKNGDTEIYPMEMASFAKFFR